MSVALVIHHAIRMCSVLPPSVAWLALSYFSTLPHKWQDFSEKKAVAQKNVCFDFVYNFRLKYFSFLQKNQHDIILNLYRTSCKVSIILVRF